MNAREFELLKSKVERAQKSKERAKWELDKCMKQLKEEFKVNTLEEAKQLLAKLNREKERVDKSLEDCLASFRKRWGAIL